MVNQPFSFFRYFKILVTLTDVFRAFVNRPFTLPKTILCLLNLVLVAHHHIQWSREYGSSLWWVSFYLLTPSSILVQVLGGLPSSWLQFHVLVGFAQFLWYFFRIITNLKQLNDQNIFLRIIYLLIKIYIYIYHIS